MQAELLESKIGNQRNDFGSDAATVKCRFTNDQPDIAVAMAPVNASKFDIPNMLFGLFFKDGKGEITAVIAAMDKLLDGVLIFIY